MKKTSPSSLTARLREGVTSVVTQEIAVVDCGDHGHFLASPEIDEFLRQRRLVNGLREVSEGLAEYRMTRAQAAKSLNETLEFMPPHTADEVVPPSFDMRASFPKTAVIRRIAQDMAGTESIALQIVTLAGIAKELSYGLGMYLVNAKRAPDANSRHADALAAEVRAEAERYTFRPWMDR